MLSQYKDDIRAVYKPISKQEQKELHQKVSNGDIEARNKVVNSCLPLVYQLAEKFAVNNKHIDLVDLIQHGNTALIKAVDNWDIKKSTITTIATCYVRNALIDMIKDSRYTITNKYEITRQAANDISKIKAVDSTNVEDIKKKTGLSERRIKLLQRVLVGRRINYSLIGSNLYLTESYNSPSDSNISGCIADVISMVDENIKDELDKNIFLTWMGFINKNDRTKLTAEVVHCTDSEVRESVKKTRKILKGLRNAEVLCP